MGIGNIVKLIKEGENILVKFTEKDSLTSGELVKKINDHLDKKDFSGNIILDLQDISYLDSSGLSVILGIWKSSSNKKRGIKIINANQSTKNVLEMCSLYESGIIE